MGIGDPHPTTVMSGPRRDASCIGPYNNYYQHHANPLISIIPHKPTFPNWNASLQIFPKFPPVGICNVKHMKVQYSWNEEKLKVVADINT